MKIRVKIPRSRPSVDPELLVRFVVKKCSETVESEYTEPPPVVVALALAGMSQDLNFYNRLKDLICSSDAADNILKVSNDLFIPALGLFQGRQSPDDPEHEGENLFPDEHNCKQVLEYALREGRKMLSEEDYEFVRVFEILIRAGLLCCSFRLLQFDEVRDSSQDDPENLIRRGIEIIESTALGPNDEN